MPTHQQINNLRQWLNEDRITDSSRMVTNKMLLVWLDLPYAPQDLMPTQSPSEAQTKIRTLLNKAQQKNWKNGGVSCYELLDLQESSDRVVANLEQKYQDEALAREKQLKEYYEMELDAISYKSIGDFVLWRDYRQQRPTRGIDISDKK